MNLFVENLSTLALDIVADKEGFRGGDVALELLHRLLHALVRVDVEAAVFARDEVEDVPALAAVSCGHGDLVFDVYLVLVLAEEHSFRLFRVIFHYQDL